MFKFWSKIKSIVELGLQLAIVRFKIKNEGSYLGIFWYLLEPLLLFIIIIEVRGAFINTDYGNYPIYLFIGIIMINFFSNTTSRSTNMISENASLIKSVKINYESLIFSQVLEGVFSHFFEYLLLVVFVVYYSTSLIGILIYLLIFCFFVLFVLGISLFLSIIGIFVSDLNNVWRVFVRFLFFATPVFYIVEKSSIIFKLNLLNPLYYFITITRDVVINGTIELWMVVIVIIVSLLTLFIGVLIFDKYKFKFAELV